MAKKKRKPRTGQHQLPPHVKEARKAVAEAAAWKPRPKLPQRRVILAMSGISLLCIGIALALWLPSYYLVRDLRSRGVDSAATVVDVDSKPKFVKVRLVSGPRAGDEVRMSDYAGMYPDTHADASLVVTYDRDNPSRILARAWVEDPPANLPAYGTSALAIICFGLATAVIWRRLWILRTFGPDEPVALSTADNKPSDEGVPKMNP
ncbi:hypothetical protein GCM10010103_28230 [Streptomyces paradoxus]|uniref:DUF3592 domain-containing protein n=1 Tax=Streptomyces paradoxus TaxID=66375 RepID=A0A7W9T9X8_9ACTN|nr:hypothetical protein [Streptomyces paradoxus]MBB6076138.1 hypothetical protein [Streptomyces paradoxus]